MAVPKRKAQPMPKTRRQARPGHRRAHEAAFIEELEGIIRSLPPKGMSLGQLRDQVGHDGLLLFAALLTLVFMVPVSIPGVSTIFGATILFIGACRVFGWKLWLPKSWETKALPAAKLRSALGKGVLWLRRLGAILRPHRQAWLAEGRVPDFINGWALILGALLLMMPFGLIPFSNTLPGLAILLLALGMLERDGLVILLGHITNLLTIAYFALLLAGGTALLQKLLEMIRGASA